MRGILALLPSLGLCVGACSCASNGEGLKPDLNITLDCSQPLRSVDEIAIEKSLYSAGFDVLNRARLARELNVDFSPSVTIDAIDARSRIVAVTGLEDPTPNEEERSFYLHVSLYSRPPTVRDAQLEARLERLTADIPMCAVTTVERHTNAASIEWLHKDIAKKTRGWFEQANREAPASDARRVHDTG